MSDEIKVGDTLWQFDNNRRVYDKERGGAPIYEKHFLPHVITGETAQSWLIEEFGQTTRVNKKTMRSAGKSGFMGHKWFTKAGMEDDIWCHGKRPTILRAVERASGSELRKIADLLGIEFPEAEAAGHSEGGA